jgi:hypothetical protein
VTPDVVRAHSPQLDTSAALAELTPQLAGVEPSLVLFFCSSNHDGLQIQRELQALARSATVAGCTTAGELSDRALSDGGVVLVALSRSKVKRCAAVLTDYEGKDVETEVLGAARTLEERLQVSLRELSPDNWVGILLNEALHGLEDDVVDVVGHVAPLLSFVGGSAGDNLKSVQCTVFAEGRKSSNGSVLLLLELAVPYVVVKTCSFEATQTKVQITRVQKRVVYEIDGQPALTRYAEIVGAPPEQLGDRVFMGNPLGVMIDGEPWVRAPTLRLPDGGIMFGARIIEGSELYLLHSTELVTDTRRALERGAAQLGKAPAIGILFNCAHRAIEIQVRQIQREFREAISAFPVVGFHSYGENYLTQLNQTLVGLLLG